MGERCPDDLEAIGKITGLMFERLRQRAGFDRDEVAAYLEVSSNQICDHESGVMPLTTARLYHAGLMFGVKISAFFQAYYYPELFEIEETDDELTSDSIM